MYNTWICQNTNNNIKGKFQFFIILDRVHVDHEIKHRGADKRASHSCTRKGCSYSIYSRVG